MRSNLLTALAVAIPLSLGAAAVPIFVATQVAAQSTLMDINSASRQELMTLPGIGDVRADAIIKGRPYKGKDELTQKGIIPAAVYAQIKDKIIAKQR